MHKMIQIIILLVVISSCRHSDDSPELLTELILRDTFSQESSSFIQGEPIEFLLTATNTKNEPVTLNFSSGQQYDFYIKSLSGVEVWRWSADKLFITAFTELIIPAQDTVEVTVTLVQNLLIGDNIPIGSYTAYGSFMDQSPIAQFSFTVQ